MSLSSWAQDLSRNFVASNKENAGYVSNSAQANFNYDSSKSALENMLDYSAASGSVSAYDAFLQNKHNEEMADSAISRAIADAEKNGISKYQLFQSGNAAAASPSAAAGVISSSYEKSRDRKTEITKSLIGAAASIVSSLISSAAKIVR